MGMTLTLELTPEQEARLKAAMAATGSDPETLLRGLWDYLPDARAETGAEVADRIRALNLSGHYGDPTLDSPELARKIRQEAEARR